MAQLVHWLLESIREHGASSVFIGVLIESVIVPIPSPLVIMGAGAILIDPGAPWPAALRDVLVRIVLPGSIASTLGAFIGYGIGFWGGKPLIERCRGYLGFGWEDVARMEQRLAGRHSGLMILMLRALPIVPLSLISAGAGVIRWPVGPFTLWTWLGSVPRCLGLGMLGWAMHDAYDGLAHQLDRAESLVSAAIILFVIGLILWLRLRLQRP